MGVVSAAILVNCTGTLVVAAANSACICWASSQRQSGGAGGKAIKVTSAYHGSTSRVLLRIVTTLNIISPLCWLALALATLAYREEVHDSIFSTQPGLAAAFALLAIFNLSALVMFIPNLSVFCTSRGSIIFDADLTQPLYTSSSSSSRDLLPLRAAPPRHPSDGLKNAASRTPQPFLVTLLHRIDAKLQDFFCQQPAHQLKRKTSLQSPFAQPSPFSPQNKGTHCRHMSYDEEAPAPARRSSDSLQRAVTAPEGSMHRFLDRDFMATLREQSRLQPQLSMQNSSSPSTSVAQVDVHLPLDIPAHRPDGFESPTCSPCADAFSFAQNPLERP
ncbi:hypothetical protein WJX73_002317 [Symbiochloris irregularis]|uniref:Uncharacterized protein n=1 Tax=Symbiochloris irregularis TaxID=706552 RepID=A0AAW1NUR6_9CHLO